MASARASRRLERAQHRATGRRASHQATTFGAEEQDDTLEYEKEVRDQLNLAFRDLKDNPHMFRYGKLRHFDNDRSFVLIAVHLSVEILNFVPEVHAAGIPTAPCCSLRCSAAC